MRGLTTGRFRQEEIPESLSLFLETVMVVILAAEDGAAVKFSSQAEQGAVLRMNGIKPGNCEKDCTNCPNADEGCGAPTEGATVH